MTRSTMQLAGRLTGALAALALPMAAQAAISGRLIEWRYRPSGEEVAQAYPRGAAADKQGQAVAECVVAASGLLEDCILLGEWPADNGFGAAALKLAAKFRMNPQLKDGSSAVGRYVRLPIFLTPPGGPPRTVSSSYEPGVPAYELTPARGGDTPCGTQAAPAQRCTRKLLYLERYPTPQETWAAVAGQTLAGRDVLACRLSADLTLSDCAAQDPSSPAAEAAMMRLAPAYRAFAEMNRNKPMPGALVVLIFDWPEITRAARLSREGGGAPAAASGG